MQTLDAPSIRRSLHAVQEWVERRAYKGWDPGDGLTSWLRPVTRGNLFAERILQQLIWKSPVNLRPLLGVAPLESTKGRGFMAWGYLFLYAASGEEASLSKARLCLDWLMDHPSGAGPGLSWGNHFDFTTRSGRLPAHQPTIVWSSLSGQAFLEAYEQTCEARYLDAASAICEWILSLPREHTSSGSCLSYVAFKQNSVHNSNLLGAAMLARTWKHCRTQAYLDAAASAVTYTSTRQQPDGSWFYGDEPKYHWIDNFHTGYNLDSVKCFIESTGDETFRPHLDAGYAYYKNTFFLPDGTPRYYHGSTFPIDIQCAGQAIDTFSLFADDDPGALPQALLVASWTIRHMQDPRRGFFYYRRYPLFTAKTPYFHWGQATMFKALAHLLRRLAESQAPAPAAAAVHPG